MSDRYELRSWETGSSLTARFIVGPGKFEGVSILTEALYAACGDSDESIYDSAGERTIADCFKAPFNLETLDDDVQLTADEIEILESYAGAIVGEQESGFVWVDFFETTQAYESAIAKLQAEYETDEEGENV